MRTNPRTRLDAAAVRWHIPPPKSHTNAGDGPMGRRWGLAWALLAAGCATAPPLDNPVPVSARTPTGPVENPVLVSPGLPTPEAYKEVFEKTASILGEYFDLYPPNPYDGRILTKPRIAPGYEQFWVPGNPDPRGRLLATLQTIRQTARVEIRAGERGGYLVYVEVVKELEDLARPTQVRIGN